MMHIDPISGLPSQCRYGNISFSQTGADFLLLNLFELLGITNPSYLDVGAFHPTVISNTALLYSRGSRGVNIEANPALIENFYKARPEDLNINIGITPCGGEVEFYRIDSFSGRNTFDPEAAHGFVHENPSFQISDTLVLETITLNKAVDTYCNGIFPDLLLIDIEGLDLNVLESTDFSSSHPKVICVETVDFKGESRYRDFAYLLLLKGFVPYCRLIADAIFVWNENAKELNK
jgi:FkbM family methyltransferase